MYNADTELLFPPRIISSLRSLRGATWKKLIDKVDKSSDTSPDKVGFVLFMVRLNGCTTCNADSFRAMHGCSQCSNQAIRRLKEADKILVNNYEAARQEIVEYMQENPNQNTNQEIYDSKSKTNTRSRSRRTK